MKKFISPHLHLPITHLTRFCVSSVHFFSRLFLCSDLQQKGALASIQELIILLYTANMCNSKKEMLAQAEIIICIVLNFMS